MKNISTTKRITLATIKSFIRKNADNLYINPKSSFDGMVDCVMPVGDGLFHKVDQAVTPISFTDGPSYGIPGAWFVGGSRNLFTRYERDGFVGYEVWNCCGSFILATKI